MLSKVSMRSSNSITSIRASRICNGTHCISISTTAPNTPILGAIAEKSVGSEVLVILVILPSGLTRVYELTKVCRDGIVKAPPCVPVDETDVKLEEG